MKLHQLSLFLENQPGQLQMPSQLLAQAGINVHTLTIADTAEYGIMRFIADDWQKAKAVLEQAGFVVNETEVLAVEVENRPGGLAQVLAAVDRSGMNVEYLYAFPSGKEGKAILIFRFDDIDAAIQVLPGQGVVLVSHINIL